MPRQRVTVVNALGLHARAAAMVARLAQKAQGGVWLIKENQKADGSSIIDMLSMASPVGSSLIVEVESDKDEALLDDIVNLFKTGFGE